MDISTFVSPLDRAMSRLLPLLLIFASTAPVFANYKQLLKEGASREQVQELYATYKSKVLKESGDQSAIINELSGGVDYRESFILACLSNGWPVRAIDVNHAYVPPAGVWAFSKKNFGGQLMQFPADCKDSKCVDVSSVGKFKIHSILVGSSVQAQLFEDPKFGGKSQKLSDAKKRLNSKVKSLKIRTAPRIDYITVSDFKTDDKKASFKMHVSGANIDDDAVIIVQDKELPSKIQTRMDNSKWLGLGLDRANAGYSLDPTFFAFPIYHYDLITTNLESVEVTKDLKVVVLNPDGQRSNELVYHVPRAKNLDSDGDGLLDKWEREGVKGLDLPAMGADPYRKDVYIEVDRMVVQDRIWSDFADRDFPRPSVFLDATKLFAQAPILNPDGTSGIDLHIDFGQESFESTGTSRGGTEVPWTRYIGFLEADKQKIKPPEGQYTNLYEVRKNTKYFDENRKRVFGYCLFSDQRWNSRSTGASNGKYVFTVSLGVCRLRAIDHNYQLGVFTHELGHTIGLTHMGDQKKHFNNKPNFNSIMNYLFTFEGHDVDGKIGEVNGEVTGDFVYSYSEGMRADLNEAELHEVLGVANHYPRDWNGNGIIDDVPVKAVLRNKKDQTPRVLADTPDWCRLKFPAGYRKDKK